MRLYVIGPVTGRENLNRAAFEEARAKLEQAGYMVTIPHDFIPSDASHERAMQLSLWWIASARGDVAMLDDWATSPGALLENRVATACGLQAHCVGAWLRMAGDCPENDTRPRRPEPRPQTRFWARSPAAWTRRTRSCGRSTTRLGLRSR